jgi:RNA polymerase sigma-70 factor (ECF subfamily)
MRWRLHAPIQRLQIAEHGIESSPLRRGNPRAHGTRNLRTTMEPFPLASVSPVVIDLDTLLARCRRGDPLAWEELVRRFQGRIYGFAVFYLRDREEARDAAQEIFVRLYKHLGEMRDGGTFVPWLLTMARNCCIDRLRALGARAPQDPIEIDPPSMAPSPEDAMLQHARRTLLYRALDTLSDVNREIVLLKDIHQLKIEEIGSLLRLPIGTIKSRSNRARTELAKAVRSLAGATP